MGVSESGDEGGTGVDCTVGTIVWVRRRNGSWWPGRILGPEELSASHLMSPRSGTPVKLLGREDASVDWYNLEKSKRVKPFRCGEFDACIERAEASQGAPIKKREKYARREDAILHALELEKRQLEMKGQKSGTTSSFTNNKVLAAQKKAIDFSSLNIFMKNEESSKSDVQKVQTISRKATLSHEENTKNSKYMRNDKSSQLVGREEDVTEAIPRMRGLQDFGLRIAPKKKPPPSVIWETSTKAADSSMDMFPKMGGDDQFNLGRSSMNIKKKRPGGLIEESLVKKRDRRRPLVQVLQSSAKLQNSNCLVLDHDPYAIQEEKDNIGFMHRAKRSRCLYSTSDLNDSLDHGGYSLENDPNLTNQFLDDHIDGHDHLAEGNMSSVMIKADESDSSEMDYLQSDIEGIKEEEVREETKDSCRPVASGSTGYDPLASRVTEKIRDADSPEMPLSSYAPEMHEQFFIAGEIGVSKWHIKGKRNVRNLIKRPSDTIDAKGCISVSEKCNGSVRDMAYGMKGRDFRKREMEPSSQQTIERAFYHNKTDVNFPPSRADLTDEDYGQEEMTGYGSQRYPTLLNSIRDSPRSCSYNDSEDDSLVKSRPGWEVDDGYQDARRSYWNDYNDSIFLSHLSKGLRSSLVDVELKVQASYQGEHVPLVSLMSRLNGKAIIGHPVQVEILEDGSTDKYFSSNYTGLDEGAGSQPVWTTARRTAMHRVPRSNPMASMEDEDAGGSHFSERDMKPPVKKLSGQYNHQAKSSKKSHSKRSARKSHKKSSKKTSLSSQKTRTLSSFSTDRKFGGQNGDTKLGRSNGVLGGIIKSEGVMPLVTCVPMKVAFSRILEAVGRPSAALAHRVRVNSPAVRDPS